MSRLFQNGTTAGHAATGLDSAGASKENCKGNPAHGSPAIKTAGFPVHCVVVLSFEALFRENIMSSKKPLISVAVGSAFAAALGAAPIVSAAENPFAMQSLDKGYMLAQAGKAGEGKCGAGKCGAAMMNAGKGEKSCKADANQDGKVSKEEFTKHHEAMFAMKDANKDGFIDKDEMARMMDGKCDGMKAWEGKCGAGKCGAMMK